MKNILTALLLTVTTLAIAGTCTATKKDGTPCKGNAQAGAKTCYFHNPANQCAGTTKAGAKCKAMHLHDSKYCQHHTK